MTASCRVTGSLADRVSLTGSSKYIEVPKSPWVIPHSQLPYWTAMCLSVPSSFRLASICFSVTLENARELCIWKSAGSPGITRMRKNTSSETTSSVGMNRRTLFSI